MAPGNPVRFRGRAVLRTAAKSGLRARQLTLACVPVFQLLAQPVAGHVQTPFDRAHGRLELAAHLLEAAALQVEGHERVAVHLLQAAQALVGVMEIDEQWARLPAAVL